MKKIKKILSALLVCAMLVGMLIGCAPATGEPLLTLENQSISVNLFYFYLSRWKGILSQGSNFGIQVDQDSFWDTIMDANGKTYDQYYVEELLESMKNYLACLYLFEQRGLSLSDEDIKQIEADLQEMIDNNFDGSRDAFNAELANYGANYEVVRENRIIEKKIEILQQDLFGINGSKISSQLKEDYYQDTYRRFKLMSFYTYHSVTEIDEETGEEKIVTDPATGYPKTTPMTEAEINAVIDEVHLAYDKLIGEDANFIDAWKNGSVAKGDAGVFDAMLTETDKDGKLVYGDEAVSEEYPNGYYMTADDQIDIPEISEKLFSMNVGEVVVLRTDDAFFILMRYENEAGAYADSANAQSFKNFTTKLQNLLLNDYLKTYIENIVVDQALLDEVSMKKVTSNTKYR